MKGVEAFYKQHNSRVDFVSVPFFESFVRHEFVFESLYSSPFSPVACWSMKSWPRTPPTDQLLVELTFLCHVRSSEPTHYQYNSQDSQTLQ